MRATIEPKTNVGMYKGKTIKDNNNPPRLIPTVKAAPKAPIAERALSAIGAFGAALTVGIRRGGLLLSLIVLPLYIPTLVFGSIVARTGVAGLSNNSAMLILTAITLVAFSILPFASAVVLRSNLR